jgi:PAS domain S-box-containing protein
MFSFAAATAEWLRRADRHRNAVLAALLVTACIEVIAGISSEAHVLPMLGVWLSLGVIVGHLMTRVDDPARRRRWRAVILTVDIVGAAVVQYAAGGTAWFGALGYVFLLMVTAVALSGRALAAFTALSTVVYGIPLFAEAFGLLRPMPLAGVRGTPQTPAQAVVTWCMAALVLGGTAALLHTFMRLVRQSAEWHQLLVEQVPVMVCTLDETGRVTGANPAAHVGLAAAPGALVGRALGAFFAEEYRDEAGTHLAAVMGGASRRFTTRLRRADGAVRWADVLAHPVREDGRVVHAVCLVRDVTEEHAAAAALEQREAHFRALLEHSSDVTSVIDATGRVVYVSPSVGRMFGQPATELAGRRWAPRRTPTTSPPCARRSPRWPRPGRAGVAALPRAPRRRLVAAGRERGAQPARRAGGAGLRVQHARRHRARRARGGAHPAGVPRRAHRAAQPVAVQRPARRRARPRRGRRRRRARGGARARPRRVQDRERLVGPRRRRPAPHRGGRTAAQRHARAATRWRASAATSSPCCSSRCARTPTRPPWPSA